MTSETPVGSARTTVPISAESSASIARACGAPAGTRKIGPSSEVARETSIHALRLIGSGLFDDFPKIQFVLGHLGERIPYDIWRIDARIDKAKMDYKAAHSVRHYMNTNVHITTAGHFSSPTLNCALAEMGADRVMFSIDYPFEDTVDGASWFDALDMSDADKQKIGRDNAVKLFKLDLG